MDLCNLAVNYGMRAVNIRFDEKDSTLVFNLRTTKLDPHEYELSNQTISSILDDIWYYQTQRSVTQDMLTAARKFRDGTLSTEDMYMEGGVPTESVEELAAKMADWEQYLDLAKDNKGKMDELAAFLILPLNLQVKGLRILSTEMMKDGKVKVYGRIGTGRWCGKCWEDFKAEPWFVEGHDQEGNRKEKGYMVIDVTKIDGE